jgi:hypothetical protein
MLNRLSLSFSRKFFGRCFYLLLVTLFVVSFFLLFSDLFTVHCDNFVIKKLIFHNDIKQIPIYRSEFKNLNSKYFIMKTINQDMNYVWAFTHYPNGRPNVLLGALDLHCNKHIQHLIKTPYIFHSVFSDFVFIEQHNLPCLFHYKTQILDVVNDNNNLKDSINIGKELQYSLNTSKFPPVNKTIDIIKPMDFNIPNKFQN